MITQEKLLEYYRRLGALNVDTFVPMCWLPYVLDIDEEDQQYFAPLGSQSTIDHIRIALHTNNPDFSVLAIELEMEKNPNFFPQLAECQYRLEEILTHPDNGQLDFTTYEGMVQLLNHYASHCLGGFVIAGTGGSSKQADGDIRVAKALLNQQMGGEDARTPENFYWASTSVLCYLFAYMAVKYGHEKLAAAFAGPTEQDVAQMLRHTEFMEEIGATILRESLTTQRKEIVTAAFENPQDEATIAAYQNYLQEALDDKIRTLLIVADAHPSGYWRTVGAQTTKRLLKDIEVNIDQVVIDGPSLDLDMYYVTSGFKYPMELLGQSLAKEAYPINCGQILARNCNLNNWEEPSVLPPYPMVFHDYPAKKMEFLGRYSRHSENKNVTIGNGGYIPIKHLVGNFLNCKPKELERGIIEARDSFSALTATSPYVAHIRGSANSID